MSTTAVLQRTQPVLQPVLQPGVGVLARPSALPVVAVHPAVTVRSAGRVEGLALADNFAQQRRASPSQRDQALSVLLQLLWEHGAFSGLPLDGSGLLRVSSPFCHDYYEAPVLLPFLVEKLVEGGPMAKGILAFGCDVNAQPTWWPAWEAWVAKNLGPRVTLQLSQQDLSTSAPPPAGLVLGVHPEITNGGPWPAILANALGSCLPGGLCVFVTFYTQEAEEAARVCRGRGWSCEVLENPHYAGLPASTSGTYMRYAVLARAGGAGAVVGGPPAAVAPPPLVAAGLAAAPGLRGMLPPAPPAAVAVAGQAPGAPAAAAPWGAQYPPVAASTPRAVVQAAPVAAAACGYTGKPLPAEALPSSVDSTNRWAARRLAAPDERDRAYSAFLRALASWGTLQALAPSGPLRVSVPFCHEFFEAPILMPFLAEQLLAREGGPKSMEISGCDINAQPFWWRSWEEWAHHSFGPRGKLELRQQDLAVAPPPGPPADLILGIHPEATKGGPWQSILDNVLSARAPGAVCVFATFYAQEAEAVVRMCAGPGAVCEVRESPHYVGQPANAIGTYLRYAVIVRPQ